MRADHDVDAAFAEKFENFALLALRSKPAEHLDPDRIIEHALAKNFEMLLREHGGRREHRDLFTVHYRLERGADCHFGFAETDVAANQAVHRSRPFHVDLRFDDCFHLVRRFAKWKRMFEFELAISCPGRTRGRDWFRARLGAASILPA